MLGVTIITPVAPAHVGVLPRCIASVRNQTVPVEHLYAIDEAQEGPGVLRNRMLEEVATPYVVFLDADDELEPRFTELCLAAMVGGHYVYTDWLRDGVAVRVIDRPWCNSSFHLVTTLLHTEDVRRVGGFDEHMRGMEDTDFYMKLMASGVCGRHLKVPLVHYHRTERSRAQRIRDDGSIALLKAQIKQRYGGIRMACCGQNYIIREIQNYELDKIPKQYRVRAEPKWAGNRKQHGTVSGIMYPRMSRGRSTIVDIRDVQHRPDLWRIVPDVTPVPVDEAAVVDPDVDALIDLAGATYAKH